MPVVEIPDEEIEVKPNLVISPIPYEGPVVDSRRGDYEGLSTFLSGPRMSVDWFSQPQTRDSAAASWNDDLPAAYGSYNEVRGIEIFTDGVSHNQDTGNTGGFVSTGSANVWSCVTPQPGDMFIAEVMRGRNALFQVNNPKRATIFPESATGFDYQLVKYVDADFIAKLRGRVIKTGYFHLENFRNGLKAILTEEDVNVTKRLGRARDRLTTLYFRDFFSDTYQTFLVPKQRVFPGMELTTYDPAMTKFIRSILTLSQHPKVVKIIELNCNGDVHSNQLTLLDAIAKRDAEMLYSVSRYATLTGISAFKARPLMNSIYFSGIDQVVTMVDVPFSVNENDTPLTGQGGSLIKADTRQKDMRSILPVLDLDEPSENNGGDTPFIHRVTADNFYIFTEAFYEDSAGQSLLEQMVNARLREEPIDLKKLADLADHAVKFDNLERFYYIPIILVLIKLASGVLA